MDTSAQSIIILCSNCTLKPIITFLGGVGREERRGRGGGERTTMIPVLKHFVKALTSKAALGMVVCGVCVAHSGVQLSEQPPLWVPGRPTSSFQRAAEMLWRP